MCDSQPLAAHALSIIDADRNPSGLWPNVTSDQTPVGIGEILTRQHYRLATLVSRNSIVFDRNLIGIAAPVVVSLVAAPLAATISIISN